MELTHDESKPKEMMEINLEPNWPKTRAHYETLLLKQCTKPMTPQEEDLLFNLNMLVQSIESTEAFHKEMEFLQSLANTVASRRSASANDELERGVRRKRRMNRD
jgi:hypothetical protein